MSISSQGNKKLPKINISTNITKKAFILQQYNIISSYYNLFLCAADTLIKVKTPKNVGLHELKALGLMQHTNE